jgi:hypothetical protein
MRVSMFRAATKTAAVVAIFASVAALAACSAAPDEATGEASGAMRCRPGTPCDPMNNIGCDPTTTCCYKGSQLMGYTACGSYLYSRGCRSTTGSNRAFAVEEDGFDHWWFEVYCPASATDIATYQPCVDAGIHFNYSGNTCTSNTPGSGQVDVIYDPNCPSGCSVLAE